MGGYSRGVGEEKHHGFWTIMNESKEFDRETHLVYISFNVKIRTCKEMKTKKD